MSNNRRAVAGRPRQVRLLGGIFLCCLVLTAGCKTSDDAAAASTQMSATAKCLSDYYTALGTVVANTDQLYTLNEKLFSKPYSPENQQKQKSNGAEIAKRAALAADFSSLASEFALLTGSTAATDVETSAINLQTEVGSLAGVTASSNEQNALKFALGLLVTAIKEHKEREAAKAIDKVASAMSDLFVKETPIWNSTDQVYTDIASTLANNLVDQNAIDNSALLKVALDPFGLTPAAPSADLNAKLAPLVKQQITTRKTALDEGYVQATDAMTKSLAEMSKRIHLVAEDKPMSIRRPPLTLANVEKWASQVTSK